MSFLLRVSALAMLLVWAALPASASRLQSVEVEMDKHRLQLHLRFDKADESAAKARTFRLANPHRLVLDLPDAEVLQFPQVRMPPRAQPHVANVRFGRHATFLRVVVDLADAFEYRLKKRKKALLLTLELPLPPPSRPSRSSRPSSSPASSPSGSDGLRPLVVMIDPGHGGKDPGAVSGTGLPEKDIALQISQRLYRLLQPLQSLQPHLTRTNDTYISLTARREKARRLKADMFLSVHADASKDRRTRGASAYALSLRGASSEAARNLALRENTPPEQILRVGGIPLAGDEDFDSTVVELAQTPTIDRSLRIARAILAQVGEVSQVHSGGTGRANFAVLRAPYIPSILLEAGFLTNRQDAASLANVRFQRRLARALLAGIYQYLKENPHPGIAIGPDMKFFRYQVRNADTLSEISQAYGMTTRSLKKFNGLRSNNIRRNQILKIPLPKEIRTD